MCELCRRRKCLPECPNFIPTHASRCKNCGSLLLPGQPYYRIHGKPYCAECVETASQETLIRFCEIPREEWLRKMGFQHSVFDSGKE